MADKKAKKTTGVPGESISLELGSGGRLMKEFLQDHVLPSFPNRYLKGLPDASHLPAGIALTTDGYVVDPLFFPGGDIGTLAVNGTVNDLVVSGAKPLFLSLSLILEEGLPLEVINRILSSIKKAAAIASVEIVTGDTKVVRRGQADKVFIVTAGLGRVIARPRIKDIRPGDKVIVTGPIGDHSLAVMLARGDFGFVSKVRSDCAALNFLLPLWKKGVLWMRDITRGGLATVLSELGEKLPFSVLLEEVDIPLSRPVRGAAELLGIDPLFMACEGRAVLVVPEKKAAAVLTAARKNPQGKSARIIGRMDNTAGKPGELLLATAAGGMRLLEPLTSELLPRIC